MKYHPAGSPGRDRIARLKGRKCKEPPFEDKGLLPFSAALIRYHGAEPVCSGIIKIENPPASKLTWDFRPLTLVPYYRIMDTAGHFRP